MVQVTYAHSASNLSEPVLKFAAPVPVDPESATARASGSTARSSPVHQLDASMPHQSRGRTAKLAAKTNAAVSARLMRISRYKRVTGSILRPHLFVRFGSLAAPLSTPGENFPFVADENCTLVNIAGNSDPKSAFWTVCAKGETKRAPEMACK